MDYNSNGVYFFICLKNVCEIKPTGNGNGNANGNNIEETEYIKPNALESQCESYGITFSFVIFIAVYST